MQSYAPHSVDAVWIMHFPPNIIYKLFVLFTVEHRSHCIAAKAQIYSLMSGFEMEVWAIYSKVQSLKLDAHGTPRYMQFNHIHMEMSSYSSLLR